MLKEEFFDSLIKTAMSAGGDYGDIFLEDRTPLVIQMEDDKIEKITTGIERGVGIRIVYDNKTAYAYTNDLTKDTLLETARSLTRAVKANAVSTPMSLEKTRPKTDFIIKQRPNNTPIADKIRLIRMANQRARAVDTRIRQVSVTYSDFVQLVTIANSGGVLIEDERVQTLMAVSVIAEEGGTIQTGYEALGGFVGFELFEENSVEDLAASAANRAILMLGARRIKGGRMPVVIASEAGGTMIHEAIGHGLEADLAGQGLSVYSNKLGAQVASASVTVIDDATLPGKRGSYRVDDEGTAAQRNILVSNGILTAYMYDKLNAIKDGVSSSGNGRRESYRSRPIPRMTNTFLAPGNADPVEILRTTNNGLFVKKMGGGQVNTVTGDFVFDVQEGYLIKNGQISDPVKGATLCGNGPEVLKAIDLIGTDMGFSIGTCGKDGQGVPVSDALPTIRIPDIVVGGEV
ncbi:TldD/PmbA family protein [Candidatus Magnetominusculus dajiuhuensis]|uniref:TldD/PmbA family protein n=1 Tax=Candidatus Magnetominusculus dajiuhuensis TaxID=3137712 RepID=UPI003B428EBD